MSEAPVFLPDVMPEMQRNCLCEVRQIPNVLVPASKVSLASTPLVKRANRAVSGPIKRADDLWPPQPQGQFVC
jgi:hypothetical protein